LGAVETKRGASALGRADAPDAPGGDGHRDVEDSPDRAEEPARGIPGRLSERRIPRVDATECSQCADAGRREGEQQKETEGQPGRFLHRANESAGSRRVQSRRREKRGEGTAPASERSDVLFGRAAQ